MKTRNLLILLPVLALTLSSCAKIKEALVVKQDVTFTIDMPVSVTEPLKSAAIINETVIFDPNTDTELATLAERISAVSLDDVTITVSEISDAPVTIYGLMLEFSATIDGVLKEAFLDIGGQEIFNNGDSYTLAENPIWQELESMLLAWVPITVTLTGLVDKSPVSFKLSVAVGTQVSARIFGEE